jgi:hypothetical protein
MDWVVHLVLTVEMEAATIHCQAMGVAFVKLGGLLLIVPPVCLNTTDLRVLPVLTVIMEPVKMG